MSVIEVKVPDIGDFDEVEVIEVLVSAGDTVTVEQSLITVESDKASMEIPSSAAGVVESVAVNVGDKVSEGSIVIKLTAGEAAAPAPAAPAPAAAAPAPAAAAPAPAAGGGGAVTVVVPDIGDFDGVEVIELLVNVGDTVTVEQSLITVESDKASMEIPSSDAGVVEEILVKIGDSVAKDSPVVRLSGAAGSAAAPADQAAPAAAPTPAAPAPAPSAPAPAATAPVAADAASRSHPVPHDPTDISRIVKPHASPSVRGFARELGVDLHKVSGSGPKQRILRDDITAFVKGVMKSGGQPAAAASGGADGAALGLIPWPKVDFEKFGPVQREKQSRIKKISAANLHRNWVMIPHVTNHDDADITDLEAFRVRLNKENEKAGIKVTMLAFLVKACVAALKKFPEFNASLDGDEVVLKQYYHIGVAADTPNGLVVPVIKDADKKGVIEIAQEMGALAKKARDGKLKPAEMQGGTFSISSLGGIGGVYFTPIINAPEVAILGVCRAQNKPVWDGQQFKPQLTLPLSLSWDHRVIDGAAAARFNAYLGQILADFRRTML
ncbi:MAG: dihydrolipoyllysine-residue acetyltransferase [Burkholderiaceae bacterium]